MLKSHIKKFWYWILNFKRYQHVVQKVCKICANYGNYSSKMCSRHITKRKNLHLSSKKGGHGLKVVPRPRDMGPKDPGKDPGPLSKFKKWTPGPPSKFKSGTHETSAFFNEFCFFRIFHLFFLFFFFFLFSFLNNKHNIRPYLLS